MLRTPNYCDVKTFDWSEDITFQLVELEQKEQFHHKHFGHCHWACDFISLKAFSIQLHWLPHVSRTLTSLIYAILA